MKPVTIFFAGTFILTLLLVVNTLWLRHKYLANGSEQPISQDLNLLLFSIWLAAQSVLAYIAFAFGKR